jgi:hypothetical protein
MILKVTIHDDSDTAIDVTGEWSAGSKGSRNEYGVPMEPDEDATVEILDAVDQYGTSRSLTAQEADRAKDALWEAASERADSHLEND